MYFFVEHLTKCKEKQAKAKGANQTSMKEYLQGGKRKTSSKATRKEKVPKHSGEGTEAEYDSNMDISDLEK